MMKQSYLPLSAAIGFTVLAALAGTAHAQTDILSAVPNSKLTSIAIRGRGLLPASGPPLVSLGNRVLSVLGFDSIEIDAALPPGLTPGSYDLAVTANGAANFVVTIGAAGPVGPVGPQGPPGQGVTLPFSGTVAAANDAAFTVINTAGTGMVAVGAVGTGANIFGGVTGATGDAAVGALGGGGSGVTNGGPAFSGTGGIGSGQGGDGIDVLGGAVTGVGNLISSGNGMTATGGSAAVGSAGGAGIVAQGGVGDNDTFAAGIYATGGSIVTGCIHCVAGAGGSFIGGSDPSNVSREGGDGIDVMAGIGTGMVVMANLGGAAEFYGDVEVVGNLSKNGGSFKIDHPLDPANKYLYHSFVESPDMMNVYNGNATTDGSGHAIVTLPDWFQTLNADFRYQLTAIGQPARAWVSAEVNQNSFAISTDKPNVKVSWQVTGIRQDAWANAHRIPVEVEKAKVDQGHYLNPELYGHADEPGIIELHHPRPQPRPRQ
jgi:hypothetical protein